MFNVVFNAYSTFSLSVNDTINIYKNKLIFISILIYLISGSIIVFKTLNTSLINKLLLFLKPIAIFLIFDFEILNVI